jgi:hypothetical protein
MLPFRALSNCWVDEENAMKHPQIDPQFLMKFEGGFNPHHPERSHIPAKVLGYGEISTVLEIQAEDMNHLAFKRMPMFQDSDEVEQFLDVYRRYLDLLGEEIGIALIPSQTLWVEDAKAPLVVLYIIQEKVAPQAIGHHAIHLLSPGDVASLIHAVLKEMEKVFSFNHQNKGAIEVGFDGQISNWALRDFDPQNPAFSPGDELLYFDTSTPLLQIDAEERLDPELFLRSAPSFLVWILRLLFLEDVLTRYYDFRRVSVDLIANFFKEQRADLVPDLIDQVNAFMASKGYAAREGPITEREVRNYYREDATIWRLYLGFRKTDRFLHRTFGKAYPYVLPAKIQR